MAASPDGDDRLSDSSRNGAIRRVLDHFDRGAFLDELARRVAIPSESQNPERRAELERYLRDEIGPAVQWLGGSWEIHPNPDGAGPLLVGRRVEDPALPTVLIYGHGDVVRGLEEQWRKDLDPWRLTRRGDRLYGRGTADNKGQHSIVLAALEAVRSERGGRFGFNLKVLVETGEEVGSPGLRAFARAHADLLAADLLIASDGPRVRADRPTLFLGARGATCFELVADFREAAHHSGNWGGLLANPALVLTHALASLTGPRSEIRVEAWRPPAIPGSVRAALAEVEVEAVPGDPAVDPGWGEPGLSPAERVYAWNSFEILALSAGTPDRPVNAIPPRAKAWCQLRYVVGTERQRILPGLREHLDRCGFAMIRVEQAQPCDFPATRMLPDHPLVMWAAASMERTLGERPTILPNLGAALPNDVFAEILGMPTLWIPHSYAACGQHAPDEHALAPILREGLQLMTGLFWDLGEGTAPVKGAAPLRPGPAASRASSLDAGSR
jgi:acetylornithine deacetylase/succinyl-diaminopimelate desuccinylase-like protein